MFVVRGGSVRDPGLKGRFQGVCCFRSRATMPRFAAVMAHRSIPHPAPKLANGHAQRCLGHRPLDTSQRSQLCSRMHSQCIRRSPLADESGFNLQGKNLHSLGCSGGKASQTPSFTVHDRGNAQGQGQRPSTQWFHPQEPRCKTSRSLPIQQEPHPPTTSPIPQSAGQHDTRPSQHSRLPHRALSCSIGRNN